MKRSFVIFSIAAVCAGCSNPLGGKASVVDSDHLPGVQNTELAPGRASEFIASSQQLKMTDGGRFQVQSSIANESEQLESPTSRGYKLQFNVQSELFNGSTR